MSQIDPETYGDLKAQLWALPRIQASYSTETGLFFVPQSRQPIFIGSFHEPAFDRRLRSVLVEHPEATVGNFILVDNDVSDYMRRARNTVIRLLREEYPRAHDIRSIVDDSGTALENQMGRDPVGKGIYKDRDEPQVVKRMRLLAIPEELIAKYKGLHRYYISRKHADSEDLVALKNELASPGGLRVAINFFERVKAILRWYYTSKSIPLADGLENVDYSNSRYSDLE